MSSGDFIEGTECASYLQGWPKSAEIKTYRGGCHCGRFRYEFQFLDIQKSKVMSCDCSICLIKGALNIHPPQSRFRFTSGSLEEITLYKFNKGIIKHYFCPICGLGMFGKGKGIVAVNVRCIEGVDVDNLELMNFDGKNLVFE